MAVLAVGLDGREIPPEELAAEATNSDAVTVADDIKIFDQMPKWARDVLREFPKYDVKAREVAPHIATGLVNPYTIHDLLRRNDAIHRAHFREKDRADGLR